MTPLEENIMDATQSAMTLIDSLDTLWLMGMTAEFAAAR